MGADFCGIVRFFRHILKNIQERGIALAVYIFKDKIKVSHRLMGMQANDKLNL